MNNSNVPTVIIASKAGRLGNRLFLSAYFMANSLARGYRLMNPALGEYAPMFEGSASDPLCRFPEVYCNTDPDFAAQCRGLILNCVESFGWFPGTGWLPGITTIDIRKSHDACDLVYDLCSEEFGTLHPSAKIFVNGWKFRDDLNLVKYHALICSYFTPVATIRRQAEKVLSDARQRGDKVIGVHIRQGDYRGWKNGSHYFETEQYAHWMREAEALYPEQRVVFLICSSDLVDPEPFVGAETLWGPGSVTGDLHALSLCDGIIAPPSTFSTWASFYGRVPLCMLQNHLQKITPHDFVLHDRV